MTIYLDVWDMFSGKFAGVLEIRHNILNETVVATYEFVGNGNSDGGTWEWLTGSNAIEAHLTSHIRKSKAAIMRSTRWGKTAPPNDPWFADADKVEENLLAYFDVNGSTRSCTWNVKR
jgi:hypothetical protein